jgi:hypothetical protein
MQEEKCKKAVSELKSATARANGGRSKGPKTEAGKARASANSFKHGFYAARIFPTKELYEKDAPHYNALIATLYERYDPKDSLEKLQVEKIAVLELRYARLLGLEQRYMSHGNVEARVIESTARTETSISRRIEKLTEFLEKLQEKRAAETTDSVLEDEQSDETTSEPESSGSEPSLILQPTESPAQAAPADVLEALSFGEAPGAQSGCEKLESATEVSPANANAGTDIQSPLPASGGESVPPRKSGILQVIDQAIEDSRKLN